MKTDSPREGLLLNPAGDRIQTYNLLLTRQLHYHCATPAYLAGEEDLNPRHVVLETTALPAELYPFITQRLHRGFFHRYDAPIV